VNYAQAIVKHLGGDWFEARGFGLAPGPGHNKRDRSLKVSAHRSNRDDFVAHSFAGDDVLELKRAWREEGLLPRSEPSGVSKPRNPVEAAIQQEREADDAARKQRLAQWLWSKSQPANAIIRTYLRSRGIDLVTQPSAIRFLPANPPKHPYPAMIAPFGLPNEPERGVYVISPDRIQGVHLTHLQCDGSGKAPANPNRRIIGRARGSPLALIPPNDGLGLVIGEGIETTLSGALPNGLGAWAAGSAPFLPFLANAVPAFIETVWIMREQDPAGQHGADELGRRLEARDIEVFMVDVE
jgi:hypothetical protein